LRLRLEAFPIYSARWDSVSKLAYGVARAGYSPPLADLYIAQCAILHKKILITRDKHFEEIASVEKFRFEVW
jgi:predicted nucleic acid-binding protein